MQQGEAIRIVEFRPRRVGLTLALAGLAIVLQACGENQQGRPLLYEQGVYQGQPDQKLDEEQIEALRQRATGHQL